jgi:hypothetical protein
MCTGVCPLALRRDRGGRKGSQRCTPWAVGSAVQRRHRVKRNHCICIAAPRCHLPQPQRRLLCSSPRLPGPLCRHRHPPRVRISGIAMQRVRPARPPFESGNRAIAKVSTEMATAPRATTRRTIDPGSRRRWGSWFRPPPGSGSPTHLRTARMGTPSAQARSSSVTRLALVTASGTPPGRAARAIRRCMGRRSTPTARRSMALRRCGSQPRATTASTGRRGDRGDQPAGAVR